MQYAFIYLFNKLSLSYNMHLKSIMLEKHKKKFLIIARDQHFKNTLNH